MTRGVLIDLVLLRVGGGNLTEDGAVQRDDIRSYLPIALNFATTKFYFSNKREEYNRDFPSSFYAYFTALPIVKTTTTATVALPQLALQFAGNQGIRLVQDDAGNTWTPAQDGEISMINYYLTTFPNLRIFVQQGKSLKLFNVSKFTTYVNVTMILDPVALTDDSELPMAAGLEVDVIDMCVQHFSAQRQQPADVDVNKHDLNA